MQSARLLATIADLGSLGPNRTMINAKDNPVAWSLLIQGISDAQEHLASLVAQMSADGRIDDEDFAV
ncbi:MAG TPA: hypothetical protein VFS12_18015 [Terriglobia bacterium]|nr:hypothetical protein [Terriglobia bacterium]